MKRLLFNCIIFICSGCFFCDEISAQWNQHNYPLNQLSYNNFQWAGRSQYLLAKIKYSDKNSRSVLFNSIDNNSNTPIETEGIATSTYFTSLYSNSISILRTNTSGLYHWIQKTGSSTCYGKDFETDTSENLIVLADCNGNTWDTAFHFPTLNNYRDSTQLLVYKMDTAGKVQWFKFYGGTSAEYAKCIKRTADGNFLLLASTQSNDGDVTGYQGGKDIWLLKINAANGSIIWQKTFGSSADEVPTDMELLADESIVLSGSASNSSFFSSSYTGTNAFLMKLDKNGTVLWKQSFGGNQNDGVRNFITINDGGFACIGTTASGDGDLPGGFGGTDVFISKHLPNGNLQWVKRYGNADNDRAGDIVYSSCDSTIFASYAKQFNNNINYPGYPGFIQSTGVEVGLYNNGNQFHYYENNFAYPASTSLYNEGFTMCMAPNTRGGFLGASITHKNWQPFEVSYGYGYTRSFEFIEYGVKLNKNIFDSAVCSGAVVWGHVFTQDSTFADTLRNACGIDTLINKYSVRIIKVADSLLAKDSAICYGDIYDGKQVFVSFFDRDTSFISTSCGNRRVITATHVIVSDLFLNVNRIVAFNPGQPVTLTPQTNGSIIWQANATLSCQLCQTAVATALQTTMYYLSAHKGSCSITDSIQLVKNGFYFYVPLAFTPNGDTRNDLFNALAIGISDYDMQIFNRWGQMIFRTNSLTRGWNGKFLNADQPIGGYTYMITYKDDKGVKQLVHGNFTLIR